MSHRITICLRTLFMVLALTLICAATALAADPPEIRVMLGSAAPGSSFTMTVANGSYDIVPATDPDVILDTVDEGGSITFTSPVCANGLTYGNSIIEARPHDEDGRFRFNGSAYRGTARTMTGSYYYFINRVDVESYLYGVVGREIGYSYNMDATMAQAVAARSYAIGNISSANRYYDVTATTSSQVYGGYSSESERIRQAVDDTRGWVLKYDDQVIQAYFASSAGGYTEDIEKVWLADDVPLKGVSSEYDKYSGEYSSYGASCWSWTVEYTPAELVALANDYGDTDIGTYKSISMSTTYKGQTSVSGRAMLVTITGSKGSVSASKDNIRSLLDLKSTLITITDASADPVSGYVLGSSGKSTGWKSFADLFAKSAASLIRANGSDNGSFFVRTASGVEERAKASTQSDKVVIQGYGYGHGVGMSQWGAIAMGDRGWEWNEIVEHYYCSGGVELVRDYR